MISLWIRNLLYWLVLCVITPLFFCLLLLAAPLPRRGRHVFGVSWALTLLWMLEHVIGLKYTVVGRENIPDEPSVICSKHQSGWETLALQKIFPWQVYVAKRELAWIPLFGWGLVLMNPIMINRSDRSRSNQRLLEQGLERKRHKFWITVFPEGTRTKPGVPGKYKLGAARMAKQFDMPLVPVAHNAGEFWPRNAFLKYPGEVTVVIGPAVRPADDAGPEAMMAEAEAWIESQQRLIGGVGPFAHPDEKRQRLAPPASA
ncbi:1-acyl-sn-glycerol-3-phosphate acyltransferase [Chromobacterium subtsugae]|uniref:1-acyl-sn-glycerol-3-phosphate acyltransferase n=1 Tax=Chromobacterium subtsugae TaxID=251747 RepID=A0ABS7FB55_9NEIS|nr:MULTISPECIES: lysophospholipid acyltransferase family protein [Chromobacterium]KUM01825.1 acyl-phosphate glycerol 3-phosphate acyltransferase [Chromobacterium subtsugae]KZE84504.1 acyl-phosphate glycerol 3-phosphate acyltransferase [Chromobacterium sp. F49]MBW7566192.1 1-acyl-sn-glycerol-3-phosphate acyltransferase [Chromobacterium subtsugae]MBW8287313.1 1-acyl-sn-glycerol-3-phosphate acyltransferase [Chromobacterium subtsugae]OBU87464.1 acyl-phosphate glycerol 3-phosphate acyltransferase [